MKRVKFSLRMSPGMYHRVKERARIEECSINALIIRAIFEYLNFAE